METLPYSKFILTDLEQQPLPSSAARAFGVGDLEEQLRLKLHSRTLENTKVLCDNGAAGPFYNISGFTSDQQFLPYYKLLESNVDDCTLGLVLWGSPHWASVSENATKAFKSSSAFKTNAFESMSWNSKSAMVVMTFCNSYQVEFWNPKFQQNRREPDTREPRILMVGPAYFRSYVPLSSGDVFAPIGGISNTVAAENCSVALLVPRRFLHLVTYRGSEIDVGMTMYKTLQHLAPKEYAMELGGHSFQLGYEIHLARMDSTHWDGVQQLRPATGRIHNW